MKTISLWQPWAQYIALGHKTIETRHWFHEYRGLTAIHAAKKYVALDSSSIATLGVHGIVPLKKTDCPLGAIVAVADLSMVLHSYECAKQCNYNEVNLTLGDYSAGRYGWILRNVRALKTPLPWKGAQGWFNVPDELILARL